MKKTRLTPVHAVKSGPNEKSVKTLCGKMPFVLEISRNNKLVTCTQCLNILNNVQRPKVTRTPPLKRCPFCGDRPVFKIQGGADVVTCDNTQCAVWTRTVGFDSKELAAAAWNKRVRNTAP